MAIIGLSASSLRAQQPSITDGLSLKIGVGISAFFGELSPTGFAVLKYSQAGFASGIEKKITSGIALQIQFLTTNLSSERIDLSRKFNGEIQEYSLSAKIEPIRLFNSDYQGKLNPFIRGGLATTSFRSVRRDIETNTIILPTYGYENNGILKINKKNALSIPVALGLNYQISPSFAVELEQSVSFTNTDVLDAYAGNPVNNDFFSFTQLGLRYTINVKKSDTPKAERKTKKRKRDITPETISEQNEFALREITRNNENEAEENVVKTKEVIREDPIIPVNIFVETSLPEKPESGQRFEVGIRINKGSYQGPAILSMTFPDGFTALETKLGYPRFSFIDQEVTIFWEQLPKDTIVNYSYHVRPNESVYGSHTINGSLAYKQEDGPKMIQFANYIFVENRVESDIDEKILKLLGDDIETINPETEIEIKKAEKVDLQIEDLLQLYGKKTPTIITKPGSKVIIKEKVAVRGVEFKIQIGAFLSEINGKKTILNYRLTDEVTQDFHDGKYKYTVGSFPTYEAAAKFRDSFISRSRIFTAYIVAYKNGKRLANLNEALK